jgi:hypothetical protein
MRALVFSGRARLSPFRRTQVAKIRYSGAGAHPTVRMDTAKGLLLVDEGKPTYEEVRPRQLRLQCR